MNRRVAAVVGVGAGLGLSIARRFAREGHIVAILSRNLDKLMKLAEVIVDKEAKAQVAAIRIDCGDARSVKEAFEAVHSLGAVDVLVFNTNTPFPGWPPPKFTDLKPDSFQSSISVPAMGAFYCAQEVLPRMVERKRGTIIFTGASASLRGSAGFAELACGKFALRALSQCLAREYQPQGIHVAHVIVDGIIAQQQQSTNPDVNHQSQQQQQQLNPDAIAESYWQLHSQDRSAWTHELDLRPFTEKF